MTLASGLAPRRRSAYASRASNDALLVLSPVRCALLNSTNRTCNDPSHKVHHLVTVMIYYYKLLF
jgi:hypothetical protein